MSFLNHRPSLVGFALAVLTIPGLGQSTATNLLTLRSIVQDLDAHPEGHLPARGLEDSLNAASIAEIRQEVPELVRLTESPDFQQRGNALLVLSGIVARQKAGLTENFRQLDVAAGEAIMPYIPRIAPRLTDPSTRGLALILFVSLASVRPVSHELIKMALTVLQDPQSTQETINPLKKSPFNEVPSIGPQMLWVLLPADATFYRNPVTDITEGRDSPEVQQAIVNFLRRPDQTAESLSESIRALEISQVENPAVNAELSRLLGSTNPVVQTAILSHMVRFTLTAEDFASAHARVTQIAANPDTPIEIQKLAKTLLACWTNDRHHGACSQ